MSLGAVLVPFLQIVLGGVLAAAIALWGQQKLTKLSIHASLIEKFNNKRLDVYTQLWKGFWELSVLLMKENGSKEDLSDKLMNLLNTIVTESLYLSNEGYFSAMEIFNLLDGAISKNHKEREEVLEKISLKRFAEIIKDDTGLSFSGPDELKKIIGIQKIKRR